MRAGAIVQNLGIGSVGARLPFIMVPAAHNFIAIALQTSIQTAIGAVILTSLFYFIALPVFRRFLHHFPPFIIGIMLLMVSINLIRLYGGLIIGPPGGHFAQPTHSSGADDHPDYAYLRAGVYRDPASAVGDVWFTGRYFAGVAWQRRFQRGQSRAAVQPATAVSWLAGFNLTASLPLLIYAVISMAEAAGQTIATAEIVNSPQTHKAIPRTIRGDAIISLLGGLFGTSLIITSGENIGVVRTTNVRSRYVTATAERC